MARSRRTQQQAAAAASQPSGVTKKPRTSTRKTRSETKALANKLSDSLQDESSPPAAGTDTHDDGDDDNPLTTLRTTRTLTLRTSTLTTCIVCLEPHLYDAFPSARLTPSCRHKPRVCTSCLQTSLRTQFTSKYYANLSCPDCNARLSGQDVQLRAPSDIVQKYNEISSVFQKCRHGKCRGGGVVNTALFKKGKGGDEEGDWVFVCGERRCGKGTCVRCDDVMHKGKSCKESQEGKKKVGEKESEKWLGKKTRVCPYEGCGVRIEKDGGCDHMICEYCLSFKPSDGRKGEEGFLLTAMWQARDA